MKNDWPEDDREDIEPGDSLDFYDESMARSAVGGLFSDEEKPAGRFVTGFDKPQTPPAKRVHTDEPEERGEPDASLVSRRRPGTHSANPSPKPAVRAPQPYTRDVSYPPRSQSVGAESDDTDDYDDFRKRYKDHEAVPGPRTRGERPARERPRRERPRPAAAAEYDDTAEATPALRWAGVAIAAAVLIIMGYLVYRVNSLSGQLREANDALTGGPVNDGYINELLLEVESRDATIQSLEKQLDALTASSVPGIVWGEGTEEPIDPPVVDGTDAGELLGGGTTRPDDSLNPATPAPSGAAQDYVVVAGDNLTKISLKFYNSSHPDSIQRIRDANSLTTDNLRVGQPLVIPAE